MKAAACAEHAEFPSAERLNYLLEVLNNGSTSEDMRTNYNEQERYRWISLFGNFVKDSTVIPTDLLTWVLLFMDDNEPLSQQSRT